jgi:hypothetical protein
LSLGLLVVSLAAVVLLAKTLSYRICWGSTACRAVLAKGRDYWGCREFVVPSHLIA